MLHRLLTPFAATAAVAPLSTVPAPAAVQPITLSRASFAQPTVFGLGGNDAGPLSPAGCDISTIETPHVSTYSQVLRQVRELKGNVQATCRHQVDELTLSVSILDADTHRLLIKGVPTKNQGQTSLRSNSTTVPCVNNNMTRYQVAALGTSYEQGHSYMQIKFSAIGDAACGHA